MPNKRAVPAEPDPRWDLVGKAIAARRHEIRLTQAELAVLMECTPGTVGAWERGEQAVPDYRAAQIEEILAWQPEAVADIASGDGSRGIPVEHYFDFARRFVKQADEGTVERAIWEKRNSGLHAIAVANGTANRKKG